MRTDRRTFILFTATLLATVQTAIADGLRSPVESPILVVAGKIATTNKGQRALFDRPMLEAMMEHEVKTTTPWYSGEVRFEGISFSRLVQEVGGTGSTLVITALDDYAVEIPLDDLVKHGAILALKRDGEFLRVSDKGPLFVVYPYDSAPLLKNEKYYSRSVWQVRRIEVR